MKKIIMYSKPSCGFCVKAKELMDRKMISYEERVVGSQYTGEQVREHCARLDENAVITTVPQIILVDGDTEVHIGGYNELAQKVHTGTL